MGGLTRDTSLLVSFETVWSGICDTGVVNLMNFGMESGKGGDEQLDERGHWRRLCTFQASAGIGLFSFLFGGTGAAHLGFLYCNPGIIMNV